MTPKEKARELIDRYLDIENYNNINLDLFCDECGISEQSAKYCALIAVDEILKANPIIPLQFMLESESLDAANEYWQEVQQELETFKNK